MPYLIVQEVIFFCVREEPVVFLHKDGDFVPYTPRRKENLHENLHGLEKEMPVESLELTIRKEVTNTHAVAISIWCSRVSSGIWTPSSFLLPPQLHDFAKLNENIFYVYNDIEYFKDEPQKISIMCEEDIHVTEEVYKRPMFTMPAYRLFTLLLYYPFTSSHVSLDRAACGWALQVINSGACLCSELLPCFFGRTGRACTEDRSILFAADSALLRCRRAARDISRARELELRGLSLTLKVSQMFYCSFFLKAH